MMLCSTADKNGSNMLCSTDDSNNTNNNSDDNSSKVHTNTARCDDVTCDMTNPKPKTST